MKRLTDQALTKHDAYIKSLEPNEVKPYDMRDFILLELLAWFKNEFFKWTNQPDCNVCQSNEKMVFLRNSAPNPSEATWLAGNVEVYQYVVIFQLLKYIFA